MDARGGRFTVKSAHRLARDWIEEDRWEGWSMVWKLIVQQQIKVFLWIVSWEALNKS